MEKMTVDNKKIKVPKLKWLVIGLVIIVLAAGAGVGTRWLQTRNKQSSQKDGRATLSLTQAQNTALQSQNAALKGNYDAAQTQITNALHQANLSNDDKYILYVQQGSNYENHGNNQAALSSYQQAAKTKQTQNIYEAMALIAIKLGDKPAAISYYKQAIQLISPNNPVGKDDKTRLEKDIADLGGQL